MSRRNKRSQQRPAARDLDSIHALRLPKNTKSRPTLAFPSDSFVAAPISETRVSDSVPPIEESAVKELPPVSRSGDEGSLRPVEAAIDADFGAFFESETLTLSDEWEEAHVPAPHHSSFAIERRKKARTYVVGVVAVCAAVAALAFVARVVPGNSKASGALAAAAPAMENQLVAKEAQAAAKEAPPVAKVAAAPVNHAKALAEEIPEPDSVAAPAADKKVELDPKAARSKRESARALLERGKAQEAIDDALLATELDPTDADAWLILGASYQEKGQVAKATAAFKSCLKEGKRGAKNECAAMLGAH